jgi:hypothetical protein
VQTVADEAQMRKILRTQFYDVESVAWIDRQEENEFAAIVYRTESDHLLVLTVLEINDCPFRVTRETNTRVFIAY